MATRSGGERWVEVTPSQFPHEAEGLGLIRRILPDESPFRAWSNFEFRDSQGRWHEVDLLLLGRGALHLIELKYYSGLLRGDDHTWLRAGRPAESSPLKLARRKAQYFAAKLRDELRAWAAQTGAHIPDERDVVPYIQEAVFLHHPRMRCELSAANAINLYGPDGAEAASNLPGISELVLAPAGRRAIVASQERVLVKLMGRLGLVRRRERYAGSWVIEAQPVGEGEGWQDWPAYHQVAHSERARIRFHVSPPGMPDSDRARVRAVAEHEFRVMSRLHHDGLISPRDIVDSDLGVGLVYDEDQGWQHLDLWLAGQRAGAGVPLATALSIVRQAGEALQYAHDNRIVHRALGPRAVRVRDVPGRDGDVKVRLGDWWAAGLTDSTQLTGSAPAGVTSLFGAARVPAQPDGAATADATTPDGSADPDRWLTEAFRAPEGTWNASADRVRLDVFGLGALACYVVTGRPPAPSAQALRTRLRDQDGLDIAVELPQVSPELRGLVLRATRPAPTQRLPDVSAFLDVLGQVERASTSADEQGEDPLEAVPGTVLGERFRLERRLGRGSTAVGLLVTDLRAPAGDAERVLKVALHDDAAQRLADEADVLRPLDDPRLVKLVEGPLQVGGRTALLLENAGTETLTDALRGRDRLSIDLLDRYGTDLLDALVALDKAGIDHRDIKPSNLGVRENRGDRAKHLVLFDFSLTRAAASATTAGTPPYLDPFLTGKRDRYDSAAERYAAAVVLFEMATGRTPVYGDGQGHPATIPDEASVDPALFDDALAPLLVPFFTTALARDVGRRHHTAADMRAAWRTVFATDATTQPDENADALAEAATLTTPLRESGLTARQISALEPYAVHTVGDLLTLDPVRLSHLSGVADSTRKQVNRRIKQWRARLGDVVPAASGDADRHTVETAADLLLSAAATPRARNRAGLVRLVLGIGTDLDAFATNAQLAAALADPVTPARVSQLLADLQDLWAADAASRELLDRLVGAYTGRMRELGGVLTRAESVATVLEELGSDAPEGRPDERLAAGLLRLALERIRALRRAEADVMALTLRRREGIVTLVANQPYLLDVAEALAREADSLVEVGPGAEPGSALVPARRVQERLTAVLDAMAPPAAPAELRDPIRLARLAASASSIAAASAAGDLHHRDLPLVTALSLTFHGFAATQHLTRQEVRDRVRVRFPALRGLPKGQDLDQLVHEARLPLVFDEQIRAYRTPQGEGDTTGLESRLPTSHAATSPLAVAGEADERLRQSLRSRSFLALGVPAARLDRWITAVQARYAGRLVDVTSVLLDALRDQSEQAGLPWDRVLAADAATAPSRDRQGLGELVRRSWDRVVAAVDTALDAPGDGPVVITEAAPLARYDNLVMLAQWTDLGVTRPRAVWLVVPQLGASRGSSLDGRPVPLAAPSQYLALDAEWIDTLVSPSAVPAVAVEGARG